MVDEFVEQRRVLVSVKDQKVSFGALNRVPDGLDAQLSIRRRNVGIRQGMEFDPKTPRQEVGEAVRFRSG
jgi:hypothetical protein